MASMWIVLGALRATRLVFAQLSTYPAVTSHHQVMSCWLVIWVWCPRVAALAAVLRVLTLQPSEVAASVDVQEVGLQGLTNLQRSIEVAIRVDVAYERELDGGGGPEWEQEKEETDDRTPHGSHDGGRRQICGLHSGLSLLLCWNSLFLWMVRTRW